MKIKMILGLMVLPLLVFFLAMLHYACNNSGKQTAVNTESKEAARDTATQPVPNLPPVAEQTVPAQTAAAEKTAAVVEPPAEKAPKLPSGKTESKPAATNKSSAVKPTGPPKPTGKTAPEKVAEKAPDPTPPVKTDIAPPTETAPPPAPEPKKTEQVVTKEPETKPAPAKQLPQANNWIVPESARNRPNPIKADNASIKTGKSLWTKHCQSCHGKTGLGDGPKAAQLDTPSGDFSTAAFHSQTDGSLFYKTVEGREDMPNFKKKIPDEEDVWHLVNFMRTLK